MPDGPTLSREVRLCHNCGKRLARLNRGPACFACEQAGYGGVATSRPAGRARLPHDVIVARYRDVGDISAVARELDLARSSVWYVIERAKQNGRLDMDRDQAA
jgi:hypothetical protein